MPQCDMSCSDLFTYDTFPQLLCHDLFKHFHVAPSSDMLTNERLVLRLKAFLFSLLIVAVSAVVVSRS